ncbi:DUF5388 domain-containing protein [Lysinibacillus sp. NPDC097195]|uniref:DUF5388 domain-containing protein n=1 Tax=Lysinibacillus sp. NPDC097195 TaxID=3364141 RepID=UPI00382D6D41
MSNLLNNEKPKKKLLQRGPKIVPALEFKLESTVETTAEAPAQEQLSTTPSKSEPEAPTKAPKKREAATITSVRVTKTTRNKLNALIQLGKADNVDTLIDILLDEYIETNLLKDEKKTFNLILDIIQKRDR